MPVDPLAGADPTATAYPQRHPAFSGLIPPDLRYVGFDLPDDVLGDPDLLDAILGTRAGTFAASRRGAPLVPFNQAAFIAEPALSVSLGAVVLL